MNKKQLIVALTMVTLVTFASYTYPQDIYKKGGEVYLDYKGKTYEVSQYTEGWGVFRFYSLQYWPKDKDKVPEGLLLILNKDGRVIKEIANTEYRPDIMLYDINADLRQDLILFWYMGAHSKEVQVWINKDNEDFQKVFEKFNDKNIFFTIKNGIPALAFKKEYPMSATNDNFPDADYDFYQWNGKEFKNGSYGK